MCKPNFVRIAGGHFLTDYVDDISVVDLEDMACAKYEDLNREVLEDSIMTLAKELEDMYNTGVQAGVRAAARNYYDG